MSGSSDNGPCLLGLSDIVMAMPVMKYTQTWAFNPVDEY